MRDYNAKRYEMRRTLAIDYLGGKCVECGSYKDLEFDHKDRKSKSIPIAKVILARDDKLYAELDKCQLLCKKHHQAKTNVEIQVPHGGGRWGKSGCTCDLCKDRKRVAMREWKQNKKKRL